MEKADYRSFGFSYLRGLAGEAWFCRKTSIRVKPSEVAPFQFNLSPPWEIWTRSVLCGGRWSIPFERT